MMHAERYQALTVFTKRLLIPVLLVSGLLAIAAGWTLAQDEVASRSGSRFHPVFQVLDIDGNHVLDSGEPISTMQTCGACHDTQFIAEHSFHVDVGLKSIQAGDEASRHPWELSNGLFGNWQPVVYRYLSTDDDERIDLTTAEWIQVFGQRHVGGGPAMYSRNGRLLTDTMDDPLSVENGIVDPETGDLVPWDWTESGIAEMNCFLCHSPDPDNETRIEMLQGGQFKWAATATMQNTGAVNYDADSGDWQWVESVFDDAGNLLPEYVQIQDPQDKNCGQCHGLVHVEDRTPMSLTGCEPAQWSTLTTGQIFSPQRLSDSGMNLTNKATLSRTLDVHAERMLSCTDCHYALNNPVYYQSSAQANPDHLTFDPRRIDPGDYLHRPLHQFAKGSSTQGLLAPEFDDSMRQCSDCHSIENTHDWLPYKEQHTKSLSCESCHIPRMEAPARQYIDWTVLYESGEPVSNCRGIIEEGETFSSALLGGFEPVLLPREKDGQVQLAPHNLITFWYVVYGNPPKPVPQRDLQTVWFDDSGEYRQAIMTAFDTNRDGDLDKTELVIDTDVKEQFLLERLAGIGLDNPRIVSEVMPYSISHTVTHGDYAIRDCQTCHTADSRLVGTLQLSDRTPGGVLPVLSDTLNMQNGEIIQGDDGSLHFQPNIDQIGENGLYILGHDAVEAIDMAGILIFLGTLGVIFLHGGLRYMAARRRTPAEPELRRVYMYSVYERLWHWLQTGVILLLLFTGIVIHKPDYFTLFDFAFVVLVHNIMAIILLINAALALFYHLASGEIRQFLPEPRGFFGQAVQQTIFYVWGIFRGAEHPFEKTRDRKLNPLQQLTYLAILNVLLPLQIITGILMWGAQHFPDIASSLGGLPFLAPLHSLVAWLFATFIVAHVYLTTTGHTPLAGIQAMMIGWDEIEVHTDTSDETTSTKPDNTAPEGA